MSQVTHDAGEMDIIFDDEDQPGPRRQMFAVILQGGRRERARTFVCAAESAGRCVVTLESSCCVPDVLRRTRGSVSSKVLPAPGYSPL